MAKIEKTSTASTPLPAASLAPGALPNPALIPRIPEGHKALSVSDRQAMLKIAANQAAEIDQAMGELWEKKEDLAADLGTLAPAAEAGQKHFERMKQARDVHAKAQALAAYIDEQAAQANHAVMSYLNNVVGDIEHMTAKNPQIATRYPLALKVVAQRRQAIADGIAQAKAAKSEVK